MLVTSMAVLQSLNKYIDIYQTKLKVLFIVKYIYCRYALVEGCEVYKNQK